MVPDMSWTEAFLHHRSPGLRHVAQQNFVCFAAPSGYERAKGSLAVIEEFSWTLPW